MTTTATQNKAHMNAIEQTATAEGCVCDRCTPSCSTRPFYPCCGACMIGTLWDDGKINPTEFWDGYKIKHPEEFVPAEIGVSP